MGALQLVTALLRQRLQSRAALVAENLALRHQIVILQRSVKRPRLHRRDRIFWVWLSRLWQGWRSSLIVVQPETVLRWHREGFRLYWRWKSRRRCGRPKLDAEIRALIRRMSRDNPTWGRRRIRSELHLLGHEVAELTVAKYMVHGRKPPSQGWRVFLKNHSREIAAIDFFAVATVNFRILICFVVLRHHQRTVAHFNVTSHPTERWTAQQIVEAFPYDMAPRYLLRDRDGIYGSYFANRVRGMGIEEVLIAPRSPWRRVGCWRGTGRRRLSGAPRFRWECLTIGAMGPFPAPAHRTVRADFPHTALVQALMTSPSADLHVALAA
jgi:putative transposase